MKKIISKNKRLLTENIYFGMYYDQMNKKVINENGASYMVPYIIVRFGILYKIMDDVYVDIIEEKLIKENQIDLKRFEKMTNIIKMLSKYLTIEQILIFTKGILNINKNSDYIESIKRNDDINLTMKNGNSNDKMFEDFIRKSRNIII